MKSTPTLTHRQALDSLANGLEHCCKKQEKLPLVRALKQNAVHLMSLREANNMACLVFVALGHMKQTNVQSIDPDDWTFEWITPPNAVQ